MTLTRNMSKKILALLSLATIIRGDSVPAAYDAPAKYDFTWNVYDQPTNNNYGQKESRDGDNTVGSYFVLLPDGRTQKVTYSVDAYGGYKAEVTYEGEAKPYQQQQQPKAYKPTQRAYDTAESKQVTVKQVYKEESTSAKEEPKAEPKVGEVYYKPLENAPEPTVYYKPLPEAEAKVYYKPVDPAFL